MLLRPPTRLRIHPTRRQDRRPTILPPYFPQQRFQYALYAMGTFLTLFLFSKWLVVALQCLPIHSFWQPEVPHHCFDQVTYYIAQGSLNFVSDVFVVVMPIPILWNLHLPTPRRVALVIVFLLGGL